MLHLPCVRNEIVKTAATENRTPALNMVKSCERTTEKLSAKGSAAELGNHCRFSKNVDINL